MFHTFYLAPTANWGNTNHEFSGISLINQKFFNMKNDTCKQPRLVKLIGGKIREIQIRSFRIDLVSKIFLQFA